MAALRSLKELLLGRIHEFAPQAFRNGADDGLAVRFAADERLALTGCVDICEATRLNLAVHGFRRAEPGVAIVRKLTLDVPKVRLGEVTTLFERKVLSESALGKNPERYLNQSKYIYLPEWNIDFVEASDMRRLPRAVAPRYLPPDDAATCRAVAKFVADFGDGLVVHTGAGVSANSGLATFREGAGVGAIAYSDAMPNYVHHALTEMVRVGKVDYVVSQNGDGLHRRSGLPADRLSELHGNSYIETCSCCTPRRQFLRPFCVDEVKCRNPKYSAGNVELTANECKSGICHVTGRACPNAGGPLRDSIIHFGEEPEDTRFKEAACRAQVAPLNLVLGTTLIVEPACTLPFEGTSGPVVIVTKSCTGGDREALSRGGLLLHVDVGDFMEELARHMGLDLPRTKARLDDLAAAVRARDEVLLQGVDVQDLVFPKEAEAEAEQAKAQAEQAKTEAARQECEGEAARQRALSERPELPVPGPGAKSVKEALFKLQTCTPEEFQRRHLFHGLSLNKLASTKYGDFQKIFADFSQTATREDLHRYMGT